MIKHFVITLALLITFATQAAAGETVMVCNAEDGQRYYKIIKTLLETPRVEEKFEGQWLTWARNHANRQTSRPHNLSVYESAAKLNSYYEKNAEETSESYGYKLGDTIRTNYTTVIDFEFKTRVVKVKFYYPNAQGNFVEIKLWRTEKKYSCEIQ